MKVARQFTAGDMLEKAFRPYKGRYDLYPWVSLP